MKINRYATLLGSALLAAMSASLCCILPMIAMLLGTSGLIPNLAWIASLRPYLSALSILTLGIAWYRKWQHRGQVHCAGEDCQDTDHRPIFWQSKKFLVIATLFSLTMLAFPYISNYVITLKSLPASVFIPTPSVQVVRFVIPSIHCKVCQKVLYQAIEQVEGVQSISINESTKTIHIQFDPQTASIEALQTAIESTGYAITAIE